jgi:hypothetical protein
MSAAGSRNSGKAESGVQTEEELIWPETSSMTMVQEV